MRLVIDEYFMEIAETVAKRSTCQRRGVGAVIVDKDKYILSTGYNGVPKGADHCIDSPCDGAEAESGTQLNKCESIHAEQNAIAHCSDIKKAHAIYVTTSPCMSCMKLLLATGIRLLFFKEPYDLKAIEYFIDNGGLYIRLK